MQPHCWIRLLRSTAVAAAAVVRPLRFWEKVRIRMRH